MWIGSRIRNTGYLGEIFESTGGSAYQSLVSSLECIIKLIVCTSVADPHVFGPLGSGSGSNSQRYGSGSCSGSGSGSFYHHAKKVRKTLIPNILLLFLTFYL
jgi:hypothetical protein